MDLTRVSAQDLGSALDRVGMTWNLDDDGDVRFRFRSTKQPWVDAVFYEFDVAKADFSMRGQFLDARAVPQGNGTVSWEVPLNSVHKPTAVAQKVVTVYLMPRPSGVEIQIYAAIAPLNLPIHIRVIPGSQQVRRLEREYQGFAGIERDKQFWMSGHVTGTGVDDNDFRSLIHATSQIGIAMFDGPFTGWMYNTAV